MAKEDRRKREIEGGRRAKGNENEMDESEDRRRREKEGNSSDVLAIALTRGRR